MEIPPILLAIYCSAALSYQLSCSLYPLLPGTEHGRMDYSLSLPHLLCIWRLFGSNHPFLSRLSSPICTIIFHRSHFLDYWTFSFFSTEFSPTGPPIIGKLLWVKPLNAESIGKISSCLAGYTWDNKFHLIPENSGLFFISMTFLNHVERIYSYGQY